MRGEGGDVNPASVFHQKLSGSHLLSPQVKGIDSPVSFHRQTKKENGRTRLRFMETERRA